MSKTVLYTIAVLLLLQQRGAWAAETDLLHWEQLATLPSASGQQESLGVAGPFAGISHDALIIAGGANFSKPYWESAKQWHDDIWVWDAYASDAARWYRDFSLERPLAYGMSVTTEQGLVCIGGNDGETVFDDVFLLAWDAARKSLAKTALPSLPSPCTLGSAAHFEGKVYVMGGQSGMGPESLLHRFWVLDLGDPMAEWQELTPWPGRKRAVAMLAIQHDGQEYCAYFMGGKAWDPEAGELQFSRDVFAYSLLKNQWTKKSDLPRPLAASAIMDVGQSHIFVFGGDDGTLADQVDALREDHPGFDKTVYAYHTITDTWREYGTMPEGTVTATAVETDEGVILSPGEIKPRVRTPSIWMVRLKGKAGAFGAVNYTVLAVYMLGMTGMGAYFAKKNRNTDDYFRGGQKIPAVVAGLSMFATGLSSITFIAIPAKVYATDWTFIVINLAVVPAALFAIHAVMPRFRKIDTTSAYEYLEQRFNLFIRMFAAVSFVLFQIGRMAVVMFLPALALSAITSLSVLQCILVMGILSVIYCTLGGLEAVVWTDAIQSVILLGGAFLSLLIIINHLGGGFAEFMSVARADEKMHMVNWDFSKTSLFTASFWVLVVGGLGQNLVPFVSDQATVQRYMAVSDVKQAAKAIRTSFYVALAATVLFFSIGTALYVFYKVNAQNLDPASQNDAIFPLFIANQLPVGIAGVVVAAIFAAAQSTISTSMNSISTVIVTDFARRFSLMTTESGYLNLARLCTFLFGCLGTVMAVLFVQADVKSLWESFMSILGLFGGAMCGLFLLGMFTKRVGGISATLGALASVVVLFFIKRYTPISFLLYAAIGIVVCFVIGYLCSMVIPESNAEASTMLGTRRGDEAGRKDMADPGKQRISS